MSRRLSLRLVTARAVDEVPDGFADDESAQVHDQPVTRVVGVGLVRAEQDGASGDQPPALVVTPGADASR
jgi:hypothetical protein